jgi:uncharacterized RDD family membrane protein YckC
MQTPEGIEYVLFPAGISIRACAWGIDFLIKGFVLFAFLIIYALMDQFLGIWFFFIINFVLNWFYYTAFELFWNGQSPGKRIMGIRVVGSDGSPVKAGSSFLRNLLRFADGFFFLYMIAFICMASSPGFRRIGDWAGDTLVIYTAGSRLSGRFSPALQRQQSIPWLAGFPSQSPWKKLNYEEKQGILMFARRYPLLGKERADEIARSWTAQLRQGDQSPVSDSEYLLGIAHTISGVL